MTESQKWWVLAGITITGILIYLLGPVLAPFAISALLAYMTDPLVERMVKKKVPRTLAVITIFIGLFIIALLLLLVFVPLVEKQIAALIANIPVYIDWIQNTAFPWLQARIGAETELPDLNALKQAVSEHWQQAGGVAANILAQVSRSGLMFMGWLASLVLIPVVTFYLLRDWNILLARVRELVPRQTVKVVDRLARNADEVLGEFIRGQLLVMLALSFIYTIGLWIVGLDMALLIGMIAGIVSFVPYLGLIIGLLLATIASLIQFGDAGILVQVAIVFGAGQLIESMLLTPWLVGDRIGLHPVVVILAVLAGGQLFGFIGVLLALPVAAVLMVLLRYVHECYMAANDSASAG